MVTLSVWTVFFYDSNDQARYPLLPNHSFSCGKEALQAIDSRLASFDPAQDDDRGVPDHLILVWPGGREMIFSPLAGMSQVTKLNDGFNREQVLTEDCRRDFLQFLSHDTSSTRLSLAEVIRREAGNIEAAVRGDDARKKMSSS